MWCVARATCLVIINISLRKSRDGTVFVPSFLRSFGCLFVTLASFSSHMATCYAVHINALSI